MRIRVYLHGHMYVCVCVCVSVPTHLPSAFSNPPPVFTSALFDWKCLQQIKSWSAEAAWQIFRSVWSSVLPALGLIQGAGGGEEEGVG